MTTAVQPGQKIRAKRQWPWEAAQIKHPAFGVHLLTSLAFIDYCFVAYLSIAEHHIGCIQHQPRVVEGDGGVGEGDVGGVKHDRYVLHIAPIYIS